MRSPALSRLPPAAVSAIGALGRNLRTARLRRRWTLADIARRAGLNLRTYVSLERGEAGAALGVYAAALAVLELADGLGRVGAPELDAGGLAADLGRLPSRGRARRSRSFAPRS